MLPPFLLALVVASIGSGSRQLWQDEHATWWAASLSLDDLRRLVADVDVAQALYYLLMHSWIEAFGDSEASMRIPSALCIALAAAVLALVGRRIFDARVGLVSGLLLAFVPSISFYGQEARPYAMTLLAVMVAGWLLLRAADRPSVSRWLLYAVSIAWLGSSHLVALLVLPAHLALMYVVGKHSAQQKSPWWTRPLLAWPAAVLLALALLAPLIMVSLGQTEQLAWVPDPTLQRVLQLPNGLFGSAGVGGFFVTTGALALAVLLTRAQGRTTALAFLLWTLVPPIVAYLTFDQLRLFLPRYLLFTVPGWILPVAYLLVEVASRTRELVAGLVAVVFALTYLGLPAQIDIRTSGLGTEPAFREAARYISERVEPGDGIVFTGYAYAHRGFRYEWRGIPLSQQPREVLVSQPAGEGYSWKHPDCADVITCLAGTQTIWLVSIDPSGSPLQPLPAAHEAAVSQRFTVKSSMHFERLRVTELVRTST